SRLRRSREHTSAGPGPFRAGHVPRPHPFPDHVRRLTMDFTNTASVPVLDDDQLRRRAPSIFAASRWERMSGRYRMVPTIDVVGMLRDRGFLPVRADQSRSSIPGKGDFTRHMIRFRHAEFVSPLTVGAEVPELVLVNSHDGTSAYKFLAGIFRLICRNGMVV